MTRFFDWVTAHERLCLASIVLIGLALRFAVIATLGHQPESDELAYRSMALNLIAGRGVVDYMGNLAMYNAGYPILLLAPAFWLFPDNLIFVRLLQALLGAICILLCHRIAAEIGAKAFGRLLAALMWALYLPAAVYTVYLAKENLMTVLMLGAIYCLVHLIRRASVPAALLAGVCFGLLALTGNAALSLLILIPYVLYCMSVRRMDRLKVLGWIVLPLLLIPSPWVLRNYIELGAPVLNTNGGFNLYLGNNPAATGMFVSIGDTPRGASWGQLRAQGEIVASQTLKSEALAWIAQSPLDFLKLAAKKLFYFWLPPFHQGAGQVSSLEAVVRGIWSVQFLLIVGCAVGSLMNRSLRQRSGIRILWFAVAAYTGVHMLFYVIFRYREPLMPIMCVLAAVTVEQFLAGRTKISV